MAGISSFIGVGEVETAESIIQNALNGASEKQERRTNNALIFRQEEARKTADESLAESIQILQTSYEQNSADIVIERTTRSNEDEALATQITLLKADTVTDKADILAVVTEEQKARTTADGALSSRIGSLEASVNDSETGLTTKASVGYVESAKADATSAATSAVNQQLSEIGVSDANGNIIKSVAAIADDRVETKVTTDEDGNITNLSSEAVKSVQIDDGDGNLATVQQTFQAQKTDINETLVKYGVKLDVNGYVTGFAQNNDGTTGSFYIRADEFAIIDPTNNTDSTALTAQEKEDATPFIVTGGNTYIKNAYIKDLTADNIAAEAIVADKISVAYLSAVSTNMGVITAGSLNIGNGRFNLYSNGYMKVDDAIIQSSNFAPFSQGFRLKSHAAGGISDPHVFGATIRGAEIYGTKIDGGTVISSNFLEPTEAGVPYYTSMIAKSSKIEMFETVTTGNNAWNDTPYSSNFGFLAYNSGTTGESVANRFKESVIELSVDATITSVSRLAAARVSIYSSSGTLLKTVQGVFFNDEGVRRNNGLTFVRSPYRTVYDINDNEINYYQIKVSGNMTGIGFNDTDGSGNTLKVKVGVYDTQGGADISADFKVRSRQDQW
ncbi:hypothetical protein THIOSC15_970001 [uncultured Thiomicrorhabdus sp.]